jgi:DHA3 family multidrug efflux protein-like MFS transporter
MTDGAGARWIGDWFGTGPDRGIALMFTIAGILGVAATLRAWTSGSYRRLAPATASAEPAPAPATGLADCAA